MVGPVARIGSSPLRGISRSCALCRGANRGSCRPITDNTWVVASPAQGEQDPDERIDRKGDQETACGVRISARYMNCNVRNAYIYAWQSKSQSGNWLTSKKPRSDQSQAE